MSKCKLCGKEYSESVDSHIVSKMFYNKIKTLGGMRKKGNVNKRVQDGCKTEFLCGTCERLFSKYETYFANNVYNKLFEDESTPIKMDKEIRYFLLSLHWRNLQYFIDDAEKNPSSNNLSVEETNRMKEISNKWKKFLLHEKHLCLYFSNNYVEKLINISTSNLQILKNGYAVGNDVIVYGNKNSFDEAYSYIVVPKLVFIKRLWNKGSNNAMSKTKKTMTIDNLFVKFLEKFETEFSIAYSQLTPKQLKSIEDRAKKMIPPSE